ncbi:MAG: efflux RND transporter periplasmic adaptor subunit [Rhodocyclaceae bacterium]|nr:efflux RND transporter periplasmic adaptor subunit [Rhodocyclaceae bacterium]
MNREFSLTPIFLCLAVLLGACSPGEKAPGATGAGMPPPEVDVMTVDKGRATVTADLPGRLQAYRTAQIRARIEGVVEKRLFVEGSDIKAGTLLFRIDARTYKTAVDSARADVAVAKLTVDRYKPLLELKAVSQQEYDVALAKLKQAEALQSKAELDFENASVPAPISGRIGRALVTEGALVGKGEATPLATIEQIDPIYANFTQSTGELLRLRQALGAGSLKRSASARVELVLEDGSLYPLPGKLLFADLAVDPNTGAVSLRAEFPNPQRELLPGMFARIRFPQAEAGDVIRVPQRAVQANADGQYVLAVDAESKVAFLPVRTAGMSGSDWIVSGGLKGGERIVVNGLQKARPGAVVKPVSWPPQPAASATEKKAN